MAVRLKIEEGVVVQAIEVNPGAVPDWAEDWPVAPAGVGVGWTTDGETWSAPAPDIAGLRARAVLDRDVFAARAAAASFVTYAEAAAYVNGSELPASVEALIGTLPEADQDRVRFEVLTERRIKRNGALMPGIAAAFGTDDAGLDALFGIG